MGESEVRQLMSAERAGRVTPRRSAALVTVKPSGSTISRRIICPGWAGFKSLIAWSLVVVLQLEINQFLR